jgi:chaperonin GroES
MKLLRNNLLVKPLPSDDVSEGGIIIADSIKELSCKCEVIEVGSGLKNKPMKYKKGDIVWRIKNSGEQIIVDGDTCLILPDNYILGYFEN